MASQTIKLQSSDGDIFEVDIALLAQSELLQNFSSTGKDDNIIPLPNVNSAILKKVIQWLTHHKNDPQYSEDNTRHSNAISGWDLDFLKVDEGTLFELISAANYLNIKGLLNFTCAVVADMIRATPASEIRRTFNFTDQFTPEEDEQIRKDNEWCEEK